MALIPITGVPSSYRVPGQFAEILFAQGPGTAAAGVRSVIIVAPKTSAGTATVNTVYELRNEQKAKDLAGVGSPGHRSARAFLKRNKTAKLYGLFYNATSGGTPATATATVVYATNASAIGTATVWVAGEKITVRVLANDTPTVIGDAVAAAINSLEHLPVTAANASGTVTLTARIAGASQGTASLAVIRVRGEITSGIGTTVTVSGSLGSVVAGADGTTTEAANLATALAAIDGARYYYVVSTTNDATSWGNLKTHITNKSNPNPGLRSVGIVAYTGSLSSAQTLATGRNYERLQAVWQLNSEHDSAELAAAMAATRQQLEELDAAHNFDGYRGTLWDIQPAYSQADWIDGDDQNDAINDGLTPIASDGSGSYIVMSTTTRSQNAAGTVADYRAAETHRISVADLFTDTLLVRYAQNYGSKKLKSDELLADGTVNKNQKLYPGVVTPSSFKPFIKKLLDEFEQRALIQNAQASKDGLQVVRDTENNGRLECQVDLHAIDLLHQATFRLAEVSTG